MRAEAIRGIFRSGRGRRKLLRSYRSHKEVGPRRYTADAGLMPVQLRFETGLTGAEYVTREAWREARLSHCPLHPRGGCGFARHGTYERKSAGGDTDRALVLPTGPSHVQPVARSSGGALSRDVVRDRARGGHGRAGEQPGGGRRRHCAAIRSRFPAPCAGYAGAWVRCARCSPSWWDCCRGGCSAVPRRLLPCARASRASRC